MAGLDLDRIGAAALAVVDQHGADGLTMRAVADALGVTPMALYHHVEHKAALVALLVDAAMKEHELPVPGGLDWRRDLLDMARWSRRVTASHRDIGQLRRQYKVWTPSALTLGEHWVNLWQRSGMDASAAAWAAAASSVAIIGLINEEIVFEEFEPPTRQDLAWRPNLRMLYEATPDRDEVFDLIVESVIDGVHSRATSPRPVAGKGSSRPRSDGRRGAAGPVRSATGSGRRRRSAGEAGEAEAPPPGRVVRRRRDA